MSWEAILKVMVLSAFYTVVAMFIISAWKNL